MKVVQSGLTVTLNSRIMRIIGRVKRIIGSLKRIIGRKFENRRIE